MFRRRGTNDPSQNRQYLGGRQPRMPGQLNRHPAPYDEYTPPHQQQMMPPQGPPPGYGPPQGYVQPQMPPPGYGRMPRRRGGLRIPRGNYQWMYQDDEGNSFWPVLCIVVPLGFLVVCTIIAIAAPHLGWGTP